MDRNTYIESQKRLLELARGVRELPLEEMIDAIRITETIAPIADPVGWRHGSKNLEIIRELAEAALQFRAAFPDVATVLEGALNADVGQGMPGTGFIGSFDPDEAVRPGPKPAPPPDPLHGDDGSRLRRSGARAHPERAERGQTNA